MTRDELNRRNGFVDGHASYRQFDPPDLPKLPRPSPLFWTVTGADFGRAIRWSRTRGNLLAEQIRAKLAGLK